MFGGQEEDSSLGDKPAGKLFAQRVGLGLCGKRFDLAG